MDDIKKSDEFPNDQNSMEDSADFAEDMPDGNFEEDGFDDGLAEESFDEAPMDGDDDGFSDDEWDTYDEDFIDDGQDDGNTTVKKKSSNKLIMIVGVICAIGVGGYQFLGSAPPANNDLPQPTPTSNNAPTLPKGEATATKGVPETDVPPAFGFAYGEEPEPVSEEEIRAQKGGLLNNPDALEAIEAAESNIEYEYVYEDEFIEDDLPMPGNTNAAQENGSQPLMPLPEIVETTPQDVQRMPQASDIAKSEPIIDVMPDDIFAPIETNEAQKTAETQTPFDSGRDSTAAMSSDAARELASKLDTLLNRMESIENQIDDVRTAQQSISSIERRLDSLSRDVKNLKSTNKSSATRTYEPPQDRTPSVQSSRVETRAAAATSPSVSSQTIKWTLKSAQPGQAMIAKSGSNDVMSIKTGETLKGIGTIKSIRQQDGKWVVEGTSGSIKQ